MKDGSLVVLGVVLGALVSWISGCEKDQRDRQSEKRDAASILLAFVSIESKMNESLIKMLKESLQQGQSTVSISSPEGLKWPHDPTVPRTLLERITKLEPDIVIEYLRYLQMYEQCGSLRDLVLNRTVIEQGAHRITAANLNVYVIALEGLEKSAGKLRQLIAQHYRSAVPSKDAK